MGKAKKLAAPRPNPAEFIQGVTAPVRAEPLVVVVCPTRELAVQIFTEARKFCYRTMLRPCVAYGGGSIRDQIEQLGKGCDVLIASPGRLVDFINRPNVLTLSRLRYLVIDEADEMLQEDWSEDLKTIMLDSGIVTLPCLLRSSVSLTQLSRPGGRQHQVYALLRHLPQRASGPGPPVSRHAPLTDQCRPHRKLAHKHPSAGRRGHPGDEAYKAHRGPHQPPSQPHHRLRQLEAHRRRH